MVGELILLPLRVGVRATQLWLRAAEETANLAANAAGRLIGVAASRGSDGSGGPAWAEAPAPSAEPLAPSPEPPAPSAPRRVGSRDRAPRSTKRDGANASATTARPAPPPPPAEPLGARHIPDAQPAHVSEEPTLVDEFAEPGAEDGAGAQIRVDEPWKGYAEMNAKQVVTRLSSATPAELAAVQLYESSHRRRQTILNSVQHELRSGNGSSPRNP